MKLDDDKLLEMAKADVQESYNYFDDWREEGRLNHRFVAGHQWDEATKAILKKEERPDTTFNRIDPMLQSIIGLEINNRQTVKWFPFEPQDQAAADVYSSVTRWVLKRTDAEDEDTENLRQAAITGYGFTEWRMDYSVDPDGMIVQSAENSLEFLWDIHSHKPGLKDARWICRVVKMTPDEALEQWPDANENDFQNNLFGLNDIETSKSTLQRLDYNKGDDRSRLGSQPDIVVGIYQYHALADVFRVQDPRTNQLTLLLPDEWDNAQKEFKKLGLKVVEAKKKGSKRKKNEVRYVKQKQRLFYRAVFSGESIIEHETNFYPNGFSWTVTTGRWDEELGYFYGVVRGGIDAQKWQNKIFAQSVHAWNSSIKGGVIAEQDAVASPTQAREDFAKPGFWVEVSPGAISKGKLQFIPPAQIPANLDRMLVTANDALPMSMGINMEAMGMANRNQPGVLEEQRKAAAMTIMAPLFASYRGYRKMNGRIVIHMIRNFLPLRTLRRVLGKAMEQHAALIKETDTQKFDLELDDAPQSPNQKAHNFEMWMKMGQLVPAIVQDNVDLVIESSPFPIEIAGKIMKRIIESRKPNPQKMEMLKAQLDNMMADSFEKWSKGTLQIAKAGTEEGKSGLEQDKLDLSAQDSTNNFLQTLMQMRGDSDNG